MAETVDCVHVSREANELPKSFIQTDPAVVAGQEQVESRLHQVWIPSPLRSRSTWRGWDVQWRYINNKTSNASRRWAQVEFKMPSLRQRRVVVGQCCGGVDGAEPFPEMQLLIALHLSRA